MTEQGAFALRLARKIAADARQSTQTIQLSKGSRKKKLYRRGKGFNTADVVICPLKIRFKLLTIGYLIFVHKEEGKFAA